MKEQMSTGALKMLQTPTENKSINKGRRRAEMKNEDYYHEFFIIILSAYDIIKLD